MKIKDVEIGDAVKIIATGSFNTNVVDITDTQFYLGIWPNVGLDKSAFFITHDIDRPIYHLSNLEREEYIQSKPEILAINQGDIYYQINLRKDND